MSQQRKATYRKTSRASASSSQPISRSIFHDTTIRSEMNEDESIRQEFPSQSRIYFENSSSDLTDQQRQQLDLITKYTSAHGNVGDSSSDQRALSKVDNVTRRKNKRSLSSICESDLQRDESKRTKCTNLIEEVQLESTTNHFDDEDEEELSILLDHRRAKQIHLNLSQTQIQHGNSSEQSFIRKPTARKAVNNHRHLTTSSPINFSTPISSPAVNYKNGFDVVSVEDDDQQQQHLVESKEHHHEPHAIRLLMPIIESTTNHDDNDHSSLHVSLRINTITQNDLSPEKSEQEHRHCSSASLIYETPSSTLSRSTTTTTTTTATTISQTTPTSPPITRSDVTTDTNDPLVKEMIVALIDQCGLKQNNDQYKIDYDPKDLSKEIFHQTSTHLSFEQNSIQNLRFGKFQIEILFPTDQKNISTIYICDRCLKHFHGSSMASQRHASKCLLTRPPGRTVFDENDLAIFEIGEEKMTIQQRLYIESLNRLTRLFDVSSIRTNPNDHSYYILCRRDPMISPFQTRIYRLIGYFTSSFHSSAGKSIENFSYLFILPPYAQRSEYNQLLIMYSYFLVRSHFSTDNEFSSPERPLNRTSLVACQNYWYNTILNYLSNEIDRSISIEKLARETFIHRRDLLFTLYFNDFIRSDPTDSSIIYLLKTNSIPRQMIFSTKLIFPRENYQKNDEKIFEEIVID